VPAVGPSVRPHLEALLNYAGTVIDLGQRQAHGTAKEGQALVWDDARRVVLQTIVVFVELDRALSG
jgi:hypothetical protein